jgi:hypothetical protein
MMSGGKRVIKESNLGIEEALRAELFSLKRAYRTSCRIKRDLENDDLQGVLTGLTQRRSIFDQIQELMSVINVEQNQYTFPQPKDISDLSQDVKSWLSKLVGIDKVIIQKVENKFSNTAESLRGLRQNKKAVLSYNKNINATQVTTSNFNRRSVQ